MAETNAQSEAPPKKPRSRLGAYEVLGLIGRGGMGLVYRARQTETGREVALKVLPRSLAADETYIARFRREAQAAARLLHPNVVAVFDSGEVDGMHYIAMEYVDGQSLDRIIRQQGPFDEAEAVAIATGAVRALHHAHSRGVLHRDVTPANILVTRTGDVKLADFGMAKYQASALSFQTTVGRVFGTPAFLSPEQALGRGDVDSRADIYSLGCVMYNMATGRPPFQGDNPFAIIEQHRIAEPTSLRSISPRYSDAFAAMVGRAMAKSPDHRYPNAEHLLWDLEAVRQALAASRNVRGGLEQIVSALDQINVVGRQIRAAQLGPDRPAWGSRLTAAFLARPMTWFAAIAAVFIAATALALWIGIQLGRSP